MKCVCEKGWTSENCATPTCRGLGVSGCGSHGEPELFFMNANLDSNSVHCFSLQGLASHRIPADAAKGFLGQIAV